MTTFRRPSSSPSWLAVGAAFSGVCTYVLLVVTARAVGPEAYGRFSLFWAAIIIVSFGLFLPVEQVLARRSARTDGSRSAVAALLGTGIRRGLVLAGAATVVHTALWLVRWGTGSEVVLVAVAFAVAAAGFTVQFPARGTLSGRIALREYAMVVAADAGLRTVAVIALWLAGVTEVAAYALVVALSALACGLLGVGLARHTARHEEAATTTPILPIRRDELAGTVTAALSMQLLLNSAIVVAGLVGSGPDAALAGQLLTVLVLARLPVFVFQSGQAAYVGRVAARAHSGDRAGLDRLLRRLAGIVAVVAVLTVAVAAAAGPPIIRLVFGAEYDVSRGMTTLVALGVAAYLMTSVTNDVAVALGEDRRLARAWLAGILVAGVVAAGIPDLVLRSALPLLVGSVVAATLLMPAVQERLVARSRG